MNNMIVLNKEEVEEIGLYKSTNNPIFVQPNPITHF